MRVFVLPCVVLGSGYKTEWNPNAVGGNDPHSDCPNLSGCAADRSCYVCPCDDAMPRIECASELVKAMTEEDEKSWEINEEQKTPLFRGGGGGSCESVDDCGGKAHGSLCQDGVCYCSDDWTGSYCDIPTCNSLEKCNFNGFCVEDGDGFKRNCHD